MRSTTVSGAFLLLLLGATAGCAGTSQGTTPSTSQVPVTTVVTTSPTTARSLTAAQLVAALVVKVSTARASVTYAADSDPNHLLGRPGGYESKSTFTDSRISPSQAQSTDLGSVDLGGSTEVFSTAVAAVARGRYILGVTQAAGFLAHEYDCASGDVLLRLSSVLTPDQAKVYEAALATVTGSACTQPT